MAARSLSVQIQGRSNSSGRIGLIGGSKFAEKSEAMPIYVRSETGHVV